MKAKDVLKILIKDGWQVARVNGSHHQLIHPEKPGHRVTVAMHDGDLSPKTLASIEKQAGRKFR